jgi:SAM-dependent methyltransferase
MRKVLGADTVAIMTNLTLYDYPEFYDLVMRQNPSAEVFYLDEARRCGGPILELGCGSGRFSIPLARSGLEVVAGDLSPAMLHRARASAKGVDVEFIELDMREFELPKRKFGLIFIAANSIMHLYNANEFRQCFQTIARHLAPGGALAFDAFVPDVRMLARDPDHRHPVGHFTHDQLGEVILEETTDYDAADQINRGTWYWSTRTKSDFLVTPLHMRQLFPQELPLIIEAGGLRLVARYGDFDRSPFQSRSRRQVCVCEVAEG